MRSENNSDILLNIFFGIPKRVNDDANVQTYGLWRRASLSIWSDFLFIYENYFMAILF